MLYHFLKKSYIDIGIWQFYEEWKKNYIENNTERLINQKMIKNKSSDKRIYDKYKDILGKEMPKILEDFQKSKYNNSSEWQIIKDYYKTRTQGNISAFLSYRYYKSVIKKLGDKLIGIKTSD